MNKIIIQVEIGRVWGCPGGAHGAYETFPSKFHRIWSYLKSKSPPFQHLTVNWKLTSSPNTSKLVLGPPDWSSHFFKARVPSQELSNKLISPKVTTNKKIPGNWTTSQNLHFLLKWLSCLCIFLAFSVFLQFL